MWLSFKYKIMLSVLVVELFFLSLIIIYNYSSIQSFTNNFIDKNIKSNTLLFKTLVTTPIMMYDLATLDEQVQMFGNLDNIDSVILKDTRGLVLSEYGKNIHLKEFNKKINFIIEDDGLKLGSGTIVFNIKDIQNQIDKNTNNIIIIAIIEIFLSILISFLISRKLSFHLITLNNALKNLNGINEQIISLNIHSKDEFEELAHSFETMQLTIKNEVEKNLQKELQIFQQSKMAQMGSMIGNIAHQWRQPLSTISSIIANIGIQTQLNTLKEKNLLTYLEQINTTIKYLDDNIGTFRSFLMEKKAIKHVCIQDRIDISLNIIGVVLNDNHIKLKNNINYDTSIYVTMIVGELTEVIINIINNAKDALLENGIDTPWILIDLFQDDENVTITIEDNAKGIPADVLPKIFDEYFSTKNSDTGMGLGLYMSHKIITQNLCGKLYVENTDNGAKFFIEIPLECDYEHYKEVSS